MNNKIGLLVRRWRLDRNYSQEYIALKIGISQSTYSSYESGQSKINAEILIRLSEILDVSPMELLGQSDKASAIQDVQYSKDLVNQLIAAKDAENAILRQCNEELTRTIRSLRELIDKSKISHIL